MYMFMRGLWASVQLNFVSDYVVSSLALFLYFHFCISISISISMVTKEILYLSTTSLFFFHSLVYRDKCGNHIYTYIHKCTHMHIYSYTYIPRSLHWKDLEAKKLRKQNCRAGLAYHLFFQFIVLGEKEKHWSIHCSTYLCIHWLTPFFQLLSLVDSCMCLA